MTTPDHSHLIRARTLLDQRKHLSTQNPKPLAGLREIYLALGDLLGEVFPLGRQHTGGDLKSRMEEFCAQVGLSYASAKVYRMVSARTPEHIRQAIRTNTVVIPYDVVREASTAGHDRWYTVFRIAAEKRTVSVKLLRDDRAPRSELRADPEPEPGRTAPDERVVQSQAVEDLLSSQEGAEALLHRLVADRRARDMMIKMFMSASQQQVEVNPDPEDLAESIRQTMILEEIRTAGDALDRVADRIQSGGTLAPGTKRLVRMFTERVEASARLANELAQTSGKITEEDLHMLLGDGGH